MGGLAPEDVNLQFGIVPCPTVSFHVGLEKAITTWAMSFVTAVGGLLPWPNQHRPTHSPGRAAQMYAWWPTTRED